MPKKDNSKVFSHEKYSSPPRKKFPTNKMVCNHTDKIWSFDLADFSVFITSNNKGFSYIFVKVDNFSKYLWAIPLKNKNSQTITDEFSNILSTSKRSVGKTESNRGA